MAKPLISTNVLGPSTYTPSLHYTHKQPPSYTMQGSTKYEPFRMIPAVGSYNIGSELGGIGYTIGKYFLPKLPFTPGPGHYNPKIFSNGPTYTIGQQIRDYQFITPGLGIYNVRSKQGNAAPAFTMGQRFTPLQENSKDKRYQKTIKENPHNHTKSNTPTKVSRAKVGKNRLLAKPTSSSLVISSPFKRPPMIWTRPSTWDITSPLVQNPRPHPMTSSENIFRRIHFKLGPTQNEKYNNYIRTIYLYMGNKGVHYGRVPKWGTSKSFIKSSNTNKSFIAKRELLFIS